MSKLTQPEPTTPVASDWRSNRDSLVARRAFELSRQRGKTAAIVWIDWRRAELEYQSEPPSLGESTPTRLL